jgi:prevent-host-death family protein
MKLSRQIRSISYLKAHAAEVARDLGKQGQPLIITQNGEAKLVVQDIESFERTEETLALLKILALGKRQIGQGRVQDANKVVKGLRGSNRLT